MHVLGKVAGIQTALDVGVVIAGADDHGTAELGKHIGHEMYRFDAREAAVKQIARNQDKIDPVIAHEAHKTFEKLSLFLAATFAGNGVKTRERTVQMQVGAVQNFHGVPPEDILLKLYHKSAEFAREF
jgi:hypothetical protein